MRWLLLVALVCGCGPQTRSAVSEGSGTGTDASTETTALGSEASADASADGDTTTNFEPWDPASGCDPSFDLGLASGEIAWTQQLAVGPEDVPSAFAVAVDGGGHVYAAGFYRYPDPNADLHGWLHALATDGEPRWEVRYEPDTLEQSFTDVAIAPSGDLIVVGYELIAYAPSEFSHSDLIGIVLRYSPAGESMWRTEIDGINESLLRVAVGDDDRIVVAGRSAASEGPGAGDPFLADVAATGKLRERSVLTFDPYDLQDPADVALDADGRLYVLATGASSDSAVRAEWVGRWDAAGADLGALVHEDEDAEGIAMSPRGGGALVLGRSSLRRYDDDGVELWAHEMAFEPGLTPRALATDCDGQALIVADYWDGEVFANWLLRFDDRGEDLGRIDLATEYGWSFASVDADPFGNPVLAGSAWLGELDDSFAVRKYAR